MLNPSSISRYCKLARLVADGPSLSDALTARLFTVTGLSGLGLCGCSDLSQIRDTFDTHILAASVLISIGTFVVMTPVVHFIIAGWAAKRKDIMDGFDDNARLEYFKMFGRSVACSSAAEAATEFIKFHSRWYGRRYFIAPFVLLFLTSAIGVAAIAATGLNRLGYTIFNIARLPDTALAAFAGAYLWVADDLILRARRLDMAPSDLMWAALRLAISIPMGYAFASMFPKGIAYFIAFSLGAFPLSSLISVMRRLANKNLGLEPTPDEAADDIVKLQGINRVIVERFAIEGITTITQLAYCDPVRLIMRSSMTFNFVTDCMNQALAWMYLQSDLDSIRVLGMRGAVEIRCLCIELDDLGSNSPEHQRDHVLAVDAFPLIAAKINQDPKTLQIVFRQIACDPFTLFLAKVWN